MNFSRSIAHVSELVALFKLRMSYRKFESAICVLGPAILVMFGKQTIDPSDYGCIAWGGWTILVSAVLYFGAIAYTTRKALLGYRNWDYELCFRNSLPHVVGGSTKKSKKNQSKPSRKLF